MTCVAIVNGTLLTPTRALERGVLLVEDGKIGMVAKAPVSLPEHVSLIDATGLFVCPGFIDVHVHGSAGYDTMDASSEALEGMARFLAAHGVTSFLPTTATASEEDILAAVRAVAAFQSLPPTGARALGVHLEGPFINPEWAGAQDRRFVRTPSLSELEALFALGNIKLLTLAPEVPGTEAALRYAIAHGAVVAIGHSAATYEQVLQAVALGLSQATHTFNAMGGFHHRAPGTIGAVLACDAIYAQIIADLVHVHPAAIRLLVRAKGARRTVLVTDAIRAAGMPDGSYEWGGQQVVVARGQARIPAGNLAGSTLTMDRAVRNMVEAAQVKLEDAVRMATLTPAESLGLKRQGRLSPGCDADVVLLDEQLQIRLTMVQGRVVYRL